MGGIDLVEILRLAAQPLQACVISQHAPLRAKHEDGRLGHHIAGEQIAPLLIQQGDAAAGMAGDQQHFHPAVTEVDLGVVRQRKVGFAGVPLLKIGKLGGVEIGCVELVVAAGMVPIGMGIHQHHRPVRQGTDQFSQVPRAVAGVDEQRPLRTGQQIALYHTLVDGPGAVVDLNDFICVHITLLIPAQGTAACRFL